jgi:threonine dehydratase
MRVVLVPPPSPAAHADLPAGARLDAARDLCRRFPAARLRETPVARAADLDLRADRSGQTRVWLALEALQITGSFKVRGALLALERLRGTGARAIAASAGNHGAGVAYAAAILGISAVVVVPSGTPEAKRAKIAEYGAEIVTCESPHYDDAEDLARELAHREKSVFVSPYDDLDVVAGNGASLGFEIVRALGGVPEATIAPFGGGGLCSGLAVAMADEAEEPLSRTRSVWGVETEASAAMARSLEEGRAIERISCGETLAEGLAGGISRAAFERAKGAIAGVAVVAEEAIARAIAHAYRELGLILEGSAAAALVPVLEGLPAEICGGDVVCVLTGRNIDRSRLEQVLRSADVADS